MIPSIDPNGAHLQRSAERVAAAAGSRVVGQQYIIQSTIPISTVAARTPNTSAARSALLPPRSFMRSWLCAGAHVAAMVAAASLVACSEPTTSVRRYAILDEVGSSDWRTVSAGAEHTCATKADGDAFCWGSNEYGQLGVTQTDTTCGTANAEYDCNLRPVQLSEGLRFTSISAGSRHTCAIAVDRAAYCWGANDQGQVGDVASGGPALIRVPGALGWAQISAGATHTCAVRTDGALFCWGANDRGQLGLGNFSNSGPSRVPLDAHVASVSASQQRTCARTVAGALLCWGALWERRENGLEITRSHATPVLIAGAPRLASISVGAFTTCATDAASLAYCWEGNPRGEMGTGTTVGSVTPQRVAGSLTFALVSAGIVHTCAIATSGTAYCWGDDTFGQLGVSPSRLVETCDAQRLPCATAPVAVAGRQRFTEISAGPGSHSCGVTTRGNLYCWGLGLSGQRGDGTATYAISVPIKVTEP